MLDPLRSAENSAVIWLISGHRTASFTVDGHNIVDLEIAASTANAPLTPPHGQSHIDPAIVSYNRPLLSEDLISSPISTEANPSIASQILPTTSTLIHSPTVSTEPTLQQASATRPLSPTSKGNPSGLVPVPSATLTGPFNDLSLSGDYDGVDGAEHIRAEEKNGFTNSFPSHEQEDQQAQPCTRSKRRRRKPKERAAVEIHDPTSKIASVPKRPSKTFEQETIHTASVEQRQSVPTRNETPARSTNGPSADGLMVPSRRARASKRAAKLNGTEAQNGWATEEATDIAEMGDFDFEANLSKFDKRGVFEQMRYDDTTADEARLVSFNRRPARPGTASGKNLHHSENVLDSPKVNGHVSWNSDPGKSSGLLSIQRSLRVLI